MDIISVSKKKKILSKALTFWIPIKSYRKYFRNIIKFGITEYKNIIREDNITKFKYTLSVGAIMKNEAPYLKEWLDFHILLGVNKFYLYDNESTDNSKEILAPYIKKGIVEYNYWPGKSMQHSAYVDIITKHKLDTKWLALIDLDEFIVTPFNDTITDFLKSLPRFSQLIIPWVQYGSSGHKTTPKGLVIENYTHHAEKSWGIKSIINPRLIINLTNPHANDVAGFTINEKGKKLGRINQSGFGVLYYNKIRCNHYVTKSLEEYIARTNKGSVSTMSIDSYRSMERFQWYDRNDIEDHVMDKYVKMLKTLHI